MKNIKIKINNDTKIKNELYSKNNLFNLFSEYKKGNISTVEKTIEELKSMEDD